VTDVTRVLSAIEQGDPQAAEQLLPLVYDELRKLAARRLARESPGQTLEATALVHEAYLRLVDAQDAKPWNSRGHFFGAAAEAMRRILVENARRKASLKRGGRRERVEIRAAELVAPEASDDLLALDEALSQLAQTDALAADLVKLRYFAGLTSEQAGARPLVAHRRSHVVLRAGLAPQKAERRLRRRPETGVGSRAVEFLAKSPAGLRTVL
jgi:RNA polymerase sigma factor (TIGR02999 family)